MARTARIVLPGLPHHVTQRGSRGVTVFECDRDYETYLELLAESSLESGVGIWCYCLMPNHSHVVGVPSHLRALAQGFGRAHQRYSAIHNRRHGWTGHLWQERFFSVPMDSRHALAAIRYVLLNPVRAGLVTNPEDWPFSSARSLLGLADEDPIRLSLPQALVADGLAFLREPGAGPLDEALRRATRTGCPLGDDDFVADLERKTGRRLRPKPIGRPSKAR